MTMTRVGYQARILNVKMESQKTESSGQPEVETEVFVSNVFYINESKSFMRCLLEMIVNWKRVC